MYEVSSKIGLRIMELRRDLKKSRGQLAFEIGIASQQLWKYENGINRISVDRLITIARVLGITVADLFQEKDFGKIGIRSAFSERDYQLLNSLKRLREKEMSIDDLLILKNF